MSEIPPADVYLDPNFDASSLKVSLRLPNEIAS